MLPEETVTQQEETVQSTEQEVQPQAITYSREIDLGDGSGVQRFDAETQDALIDKLAEAQRNASVKIGQQQDEIKDLRRKAVMGDSLTPDPNDPIPEFKPRQLTADEQFTIDAQFQNPATRGQAIRSLLEAEIGAPLETLRKSMTKAEIFERSQRAKEEADSFTADHPEYSLTPSNSKTMMEYMGKKDLALTKKNFEIAFRELSQAGLLDLREPNEDKRPEPVNRAADSAQDNGRRPRSASTGLASRTPISPREESAKGPTKQDIEDMPMDTYKEKMRDPIFRAHVDRVMGQSR